MNKRFEAHLNQLHDMIGYIRGYAVKTAFSDADLYQIELAVGEALVNIIHYAYPSANGSIEIECQQDQTNLSICISDHGIPFNPLNSGKNLDVQTNVKNASIGGYGIFFIIKNMDEVKYCHENGKNILTLVKTKV